MVVEETVRAAAQTVDEWEIVIVDDASRDGTASVAERLAGTHPQVRLARHEKN